MPTPHDMAADPKRDCTLVSTEYALVELERAIGHALSALQQARLAPARAAYAVLALESMREELAALDELLASEAQARAAALCPAQLRAA